MSLTDEDHARLLSLLDATAPEEIDCTELVDRVAGFIEQMRPDCESPHGYEAVVQHLRVCPECLELFETLHRLVHDRDPPDPR